MDKNLERSFIVAEADRQIKFFQDMVKAVQKERDDAQAENSKLRETLKRIVALYDDLRARSIPMMQSEYDILALARAALTETQKGGA